MAHCGESMAGEFCWSLTATDVHTQWTETRAVFNRGQYEVAKRIAEIEAVLPFAILGFDTDNGGEFLISLSRRPSAHTPTLRTA